MTPHERPTGISRRRLLAAGGGVAASTLAAAWPRAPQAQAGEAVEAFMMVSQYITGHQDLDRTLGQRLLSALVRRDGGFPQALQTVNLRVQAGVPPERLQSTLGAEGDAVREVPVQIATAWYLGEVGERRPQGAGREDRAANESSPGVEVVAYEKALMFAAVADVLTVPSYCRDLPGYWATPPGASGT